MKKTLLVLSSLLLLAVPELLQAQAGSGDGFEYSINSYNANTITITNYDGSSGDVIIPTNINGLLVTSIGGGAFEFGGLTNVTIPNSVTSIESNAFQQCGLLTSIIIPNSVTNVGAGAFLLCNRLTNLTIGTNVTSIGGGAFFDCSMASVTIPNSVTSIGDEAFTYCGEITNLVIGNSVTNIGNEAFEYCDSLDSVTIPASVASIGSEAFGYCQFLFSVYFMGNAPANDGAAFTNNSMVTVYYLSGTSGWSSTFGGRPTVSSVADLYTFFKVPDDGQHPYAALTLAGSALYGTTGFGGSFGDGTVFAISTNGTSYTILHNFGSVANDGANPSAGLTLAGSTLYGTTESGGSLGYGTIFAINSDGTGYTVLHNFGSVVDDGIVPLAGLTLAGSTLYGTTQSFGCSGSGTIFAINTDGSGYTNLYCFGSVADDGEMAGSSADLTLVGSKLYGTAPHGGIYNSSEYGYGTVFAINTDGSGYTNLYRFGSVANDGAVPFYGQLTLAGSTLYGTTYEGLGSSSNGTIFAINTDGTGYTNLYSFGSVANDGAYPQAGLTLAGSTLYGTTYGGGSLGIGTIFAINTNGSGYTVLASCAGLSADGGAYPNGLTLVGSMLYGTTSCGGSSGYGTVFELTTNTVQMAIITVQASPTAGGTVSGGGIYPVGTHVQIVATANTGWTFSGWSDGGAQTHTITVPAGTSYSRQPISRHGRRLPQTSPLRELLFLRILEPQTISVGFIK
jgi:uncharacterized repeat protein (TIGR03803 family)